MAGAGQGAGQGAPARMPTRITVRYLGSEVGKKVARPDTEGGSYIVRDVGQQPTTWMGTGCCSTGGNQQLSQPSAEQGLQPGKEPARWY